MKSTMILAVVASFTDAKKHFDYVFGVPMHILRPELYEPIVPPQSPSLLERLTGYEELESQTNLSALTLEEAGLKPKPKLKAFA